MDNLKSLVLTCILTIVGMSSFFSSCNTISPGNVGIVFNSVTGNLNKVGQGITFTTPFVTRVQEYPVSLRTYTMVAKNGEGSSSADDSIDLPTKEGQHIKQDISVTYNTDDNKATEVFKSFKGASIEDIESTFIRRTIITVSQNISGKMSLTEIISIDRGKFEQAVQAGLIEEFSKMGFHVDKVNLGASHLPKAIEEQMQQKMAAQQSAQQADYELQKQETLAKAKIAQARGESEANRLLQQSMSPTMIELERIKKWDGHVPQVSGTGNVMIKLNQ